MVQENKSFVLWLTGLSGSGKSTLADAFYDYIAQNGHRVEKLDGDVIRGFFPLTGFSKADRDAHIKRVGFLASMLEKHDVVVIASFISPYREARRFVRGMCTNFIEVHISTSLAECQRRDPKGLYKKVLAGEIKNFTGVDDPYEEPEGPEVVVDTEGQSVEQSVSTIIDYVRKRFGLE